MIETREIPGSKLIQLQLLAAVAAPELDYAAVENLLKQEPSLLYRLLRYINSPALGLRSEVHTIRHALGVLAALDQRIALRYAMPALTPDQTSGYITHHLTLAGRSDPLFSDDAAALIHDAARGLPRAVNNLATQALVAAWAARKNIVDEHSARAAVTEITTD